MRETKAKVHAVSPLVHVFKYSPAVLTILTILIILTPPGLQQEPHRVIIFSPTNPTAHELS